MRKKGFTLIELLAVIVILAIIALIAIPTVMKVIENSKKGAVERSTENFINAAEQELAKGEMENNPIVDGSYTVTTESGSKYIVSDSDSNKKYEVKMNGTMPDDGSKLIISGGKITGLSSFTLDGYTVTLDESKQVVAIKTPEIAKICVPSGGTSSGDFTVGSQYDCTVADDTTYTFYVISTNGDNVDLLMNRNLDNSEVNGCMFNEGLISTLRNLTDGWTNINERTDNYIANRCTPTWTETGEFFGCGDEYYQQEFSFVGARAKILSVEEISNIVGVELSYNETNTIDNPIFSAFTANYGYWTVTPLESDTQHMYYVGTNDCLEVNSVESFDVTCDSSNEIRPAITVPRNQFR